MSRLTIEVWPQPVAVCRLPPLSTRPSWVSGDLVSVTRTPSELSIVCAADAVPTGQQVEGPFRVLAVAGRLDFALTGVLASLLRPLAEAEIPVFTISTFDTDLVLAPAERIAEAVAALRGADVDVRD